ncbi:MAG: PQQ-dependent sugar dehydrogenase [Myxococcales bacterium]|nr:PQQ-dependent sugar dehydrogenase [Myxococcales bacterium]
MAAQSVRASDELPSGFSLELVAQDLNYPVDMAFAPPPDNRTFYVEFRTGNVRVIQDGAVVSEPWVTIPELAIAECCQGLLGIELDPDFIESGYVYLFYTQVHPSSLNGVRNRIVRYTDVNGRGTDGVVLLDDLPANETHNGGSIRFAPDGTLMIWAGNIERDGDSGSQDLRTLNGKILRINADGSIPADNPFLTTPQARPEIFSFGHRNGFGLVPDRITTGPLRAYETENGPFRRDELNLVYAGLNYGWNELSNYYPDIQTENSQQPLWIWNRKTEPEPMAPTQVEQYDGNAYPLSLRGSLFVGQYHRSSGATPNRSVIRRIVVDASGNSVVSESRFLNGFLPPALSRNVIAVRQAPDGLLYFTVVNAIANTDQKGELYRILLTQQGLLNAIVASDSEHPLGEVIISLRRKAKIL